MADTNKKKKKKKKILAGLFLGLIKEQCVCLRMTNA